MYSSLSTKEKRIYDLLVKGVPQQEIADKVFVSFSTVKFHTTNIRKKFGGLTTSQVIANHYLQQTDNYSYEYLYRKGVWLPCTLVIPQKDECNCVVIKTKHRNAYKTVHETHVRKREGDHSWVVNQKL